MDRLRPLLVVAALLVASSAAAGDYVVRRGDTLSAIAARLGVGVKELARHNGIADPDRIVAGQALRVPGAPVPISSSRPVSHAGATHVVARGEHLFGIARRYGTTVGDLVRRNGLRNADTIRIGQRLEVPTHADAPGAPTAPSAVGVHVVARGEHLAGIARRYGTTVGDLVRRNGLRNANSIRIGQRLQVPGAPSAPALSDGRCPVAGAGRWDFSPSFGDPRPGGRRHQGIDVFARRGKPVVAPLDGIVRNVSNPIGGIAFELVTPDGARIYGAHLGRLTVTGAVQAGTRIGTVGTSGNAEHTPPHLHLEWHPDGSGAVDPYPLVARWCR